MGGGRWDDVRIGGPDWTIIIIMILPTKEFLLRVQVGGGKKLNATKPGDCVFHAPSSLQLWERTYPAEGKKSNFLGLRNQFGKCPQLFPSCVATCWKLELELSSREHLSVCQNYYFSYSLWPAHAQIYFKNMCNKKISTLKLLKHIFCV